VQRQMKDLKFEVKKDSKMEVLVIFSLASGEHSQKVSKKTNRLEICHGIEKFLIKAS
jgi:hypothetical protein